MHLKWRSMVASRPPHLAFQGGFLGSVVVSGAAI